MKHLCLLPLLLLPSVLAAQEIDARPEFRGKYYLTIVYGSPMTEKCQELYRFLRTDESMKHLRSQVIFNEYDSDTRRIKESAWAQYIGPERPSFLLQSQHDEDGRAHVVFFAKGPELKFDACFIDALRKSLKDYATYNKLKTGTFEEWITQRPFCPGPRCPAPDPQPTPDQPAVQPITPTIDVDVNVDTDEEDEEEESDEASLSIVLAVVVLLVALSLGGYSYQRQQG